MPRGKRITSNPDESQTPAPRRGGRRKKVLDADPALIPAPREPVVEERDPALAAAEAELIAKYPNRKIKLGSLLPTGAVTELGHKRTIIIMCDNCGAERRVATSDVHHCRLCRDCKKQSKKSRAKPHAPEDE